MTNTVSHGTRPRHVQTSVVKKSAPAITAQFALQELCHEVGRDIRHKIPVAAEPESAHATRRQEDPP